MYQNQVFITFTVGGSGTTDRQVQWSVASDGIDFSGGNNVKGALTNSAGATALVVLYNTLYLFYPGDSTTGSLGLFYYQIYLPATGNWTTRAQPVVGGGQSISNVYQGLSATLYAWSNLTEEECKYGSPPQSGEDSSAPCAIVVAWSDNSANTAGWWTTLGWYDVFTPTLVVFIDYPSSGKPCEPLSFIDGVGGSGQAGWGVQSALVAVYSPSPQLLLFQLGSGAPTGEEYYLTWTGAPFVSSPPSQAWFALNPYDCGEYIVAGSGFSATTFVAGGCSDVVLVTHLSTSITTPTVQFDLLYAPLTVWGGPYNLTLSSGGSVVSAVGATPEVLYFNGSVFVYYVNALMSSQLQIASSPV